MKQIVFSVSYTSWDSTRSSKLPKLAQTINRAGMQIQLLSADHEAPGGDTLRVVGSSFPVCLLASLLREHIEL
jgi:hypothetical protein